MKIKPIKPLSEYKRGEIAKIILKSLVVGGLLVAVVAMPGLAQILKMFQPQNARGRYKIERTLRTLQKNRLVSITYKNGKEFVTITAAGKSKVLQYDFDDLDIKKPKRWDKQWRIVIFDIPNTKKKLRMALNLKLHDMNFYPFQESAFISPYECRDEIDFVAEYLGVRSYVKYALVKEVDDEYKLKKAFNLT